jgi:Holliday junction resolvase RusA-like endonuclease
MNTITFTLPSCPPSVNSLYRIFYAERTVRKKPEVIDWQTRAKLCIRRLPEPEAPSSIIRVDRIYYYPWFSSEGRWLQRDTANMDKMLFDVIADKLGFQNGDTRFKVGMMDSRNSKVERTIVTLREVSADEWNRWTRDGELEVKRV